MPEHLQDDPDIPVYSEFDLAKISAALGIAKLSNAQGKKLERARLIYILIRGTDPSTKDDLNPISVRPTRSQHREALQQVASAARALASAPAQLKDTYRARLERVLTSLDLLLTELMRSKGEFDLTNDEDVLKLAVLAETERGRIPPKGHEPRLARLHFVRELAPIFQEVRGAPAGRAVRQVESDHSEAFSYEEFGPFRKFVCAALGPLNSEALRGVDRDIKRSIAELKGPSNSQNA